MLCPRNLLLCVHVHVHVHVQVYIEGLYDEELPQRAAAADMLCQLFRNSANMQVGLLGS
jgi:hypothetical protein